MKKVLLVFTVTVLIIGCKPNPNKQTTVEKVKKDTSDLAIDHAIDADSSQAPRQRVVTDLSLLELDWSNTVLKMYMAFSDKPSLQLARKDNAAEDWIYDNTIRTDSAVFDVYRIGHDAAAADGSDSRYTIDQWVYIDTAKKQLYEYNRLDNKLTRWWTDEEISQFFYPVYQLSPKTTAMVINFRQGRNRSLLDSLFDQYCPEGEIYHPRHLPRGWKMYDSSGYYDLVKSDRLEKVVKKYYNPEFYVYGTKGYAKARIKDIVFGVDECVTNIFAFCFDNASIQSIGHPVFCSTKLLDLNYANDFNALEKRLSNYFLASGAYNLDSTYMKVLGNAGSLYFTYYDDFSWSKRSQQTSIKFPGRGVWWLEKRQIAPFWVSGLALICD